MGTQQQTSQIAGLVMLIILALATVFFVTQDLKPAAVAETAPATEHSSDRAMHHLRRIARLPHPIGSAEHRLVRDYLLTTLAELGVEVELQEAVVWRPRRQGFAVAASVDNVVARIRGTGDGTAILLDAHYDSVPLCAGAADDGAAVAMLLETVRALQAGPPLRNDVIVLLNDAEEVGMLGAQAFVDQHRWAGDVGLVLNFEARGSSGASLMFQTSAGHLRRRTADGEWVAVSNAWLIQELARVAPYPVASSLTYEVYRRLPNNTNFTVYRRAGHAGYDFAFIDELPAYHTRLDSIENLDPSSLQHHGSYALALVRHLGNLELAPDASATDVTDCVYFNLAGPWLVIYPMSWVIPLAILVALATVAVTASGLVRKRLSGSGLVKSALLTLLCLLVMPTLVWLLRWLLLRLHPGYAEMLQGEPYNGKLYTIAYCLLALAVVSGLMAVTRSRWRLRPAELALGAAYWWLLAMVVVAIQIPGGSFLLTWPLLLALLGIGCSLWSSRAGGDRTQAFDRDEQAPMPVAVVIVLTVLALPILALVAPLVELLLIGLSWSKAHVVIVLVTALLCLLALQLDAVRWGRRRPLAALALVLSLVFLIAGRATSGFNREHPRPNSLVYTLDADQRRATWTSHDRQLDSWTGKVFTASTWHGPGSEIAAPVLPLPAPELEVIGEEVRDGVRRLQLKVRSLRYAPTLRISAVNEVASVLSLAMADERIEAGEPCSGRRVRLTYYDPPVQGLELTLEVSDGETVRVLVEDQTYDLPKAAELGLQPRPRRMMSKPRWSHKLTTVLRELEL
jgi:hypothetical protein